MKVSFVRYNKNGRSWNGPFVNGEEMAVETVRNKENSSASMVKGRSFKDVIKGVPLHTKDTEGESKEEGEKAELDRMKFKGRTDMRYLKGLCWRLLEEVFSSNNVEEMKR